MNIPIVANSKFKPGVLYRFFDGLFGVSIVFARFMNSLAHSSTITDDVCLCYKWTDGRNTRRFALIRTDLREAINYQVHHREWNRPYLQREALRRRGQLHTFRG